MSLRIKTLLVVAATMIMLLAIFLVLTRLIITDSYTRLEQQDTTAHVERAANAVKSDLTSLDRTANDYASWDDTYSFMETHDQSYLDTNFPDSTFTNQHLSLVVLINVQGEIAFAKALDLDREEAIPVGAGVLDQISHNPALLRPTQSMSATAGLVMLPTGPMLVAVRPILTSLETGPVHGGLLMGRALSASEITQLSELTQLDMALLPPNAEVSPDDQAARAALSRQQPVVVRPIDEQVVQGYTWLNDVNGDPALLLRVTRARDIYQQGQTTLSYLVLMLILGGIVVGMMTAGLLEYTVILRLGRLNREVHAIGVSSDFSQRVSSQGKDELGQLSAEIDHMLDSLESAERLLSQREREAITLLDSIPAYAFFKDAAGRYIVANQRFCEALHHMREEVVGKTDYDLYSAERAERYRADDVSVMEHGESREDGEETIGQEPNAIVLATRKVPLKDEHGAVIGLIGLTFDITDRKRTAQELAIARDQALAALRFKSQLLANVSHDLRTPIGAILGFTEMLQEGIYGPLQEQQANPLTRIIVNCHQLARLVSDLLEQSRLDAGKLVLHPRPFAPVDLVEAVRASAGLSARDKELTLVGKVDSDVPQEITGDYERVHQIVQNLVDNAIRFTDKGSIIIHLSCSDETHYAIRVIDTGRGIPAEEQSLVFEAFQQGSVPAAGRYKGLGLGLSIVKQLAGLMGGEVKLDSQLGRGTTFTVVLPLAPETKEL